MSSTRRDDGGKAEAESLDPEESAADSNNLIISDSEWQIRLHDIPVGGAVEPFA